MAQSWRTCWIIRRARASGEQTYQVCYHDLDTHRRVYARSFHDERLAESYRNRLELWLNGEGPAPHGASATQQPSPPGATPRRPWQVTTQGWMNSRPLREKTRLDYQVRFRQFAKVTGVAHIDDVTEQMISDFLAGLQRQGRSRATIGGYLRQLAGFFRTLAPPVNPSPITSQLISTWRPYRIIKRARPHIYTDAEFAAIIAACDQVKRLPKANRSPLWWKTFITLLHDCGLRLNEAAHLLWADVDLKQGLVRIQPHKGLPGVWDWEPKGTSHRAVPMTPSLQTLLTQLRVHHPQEEVPYVFLSAQRYSALRREGLHNGRCLLNGLRRGFVIIRKRAGIPEGCIHDLRRTFCTNWLRKLPPADVQLLAGHQDLMTTMRLYNEQNQGRIVERARILLPA